MQSEASPQLFAQQSPPGQFKGVVRDPEGFWKVRLKYAGGKRLYLGRFADLGTAARIHDRAALLLHGPSTFTYLGVDKAAADDACPLSPAIQQLLLETGPKLAASKRRKSQDAIVREAQAAITSCMAEQQAASAVPAGAPGAAVGAAQAAAVAAAAAGGDLSRSSLLRLSVLAQQKPLREASFNSSLSTPSSDATSWAFPADDPVWAAASTAPSAALGGDASYGFPGSSGLGAADHMSINAPLGSSPVFSAAAGSGVQQPGGLLGFQAASSSSGSFCAGDVRVGAVGGVRAPPPAGAPSYLQQDNSALLSAALAMLCNQQQHQATQAPVYGGMALQHLAGGAQLPLNVGLQASATAPGVLPAAASPASVLMQLQQLGLA